MRDLDAPMASYRGPAPYREGILLARDRRFAVTQLAKDVPAGPQGQPAHKAGSEVVLIEAAVVDGLGGISFALPRPSELLLHGAKAALTRAARLRNKSLHQTARPRWSQPGVKFRFTNEVLLLDFFGEAMAGVMLAYAAVDARLNEFFTQPVEHKGETVSVEQVQGHWSVKRKIETIAQVTTLEWFNDAVSDELEELKILRDMVIHIRTDHIAGRYPGFLEDGNQSLLWARLLNEADLEKYGRLAERILDGLKNRTKSPGSDES